MKKYTIPIALFALIAFFANAYGILKPFAFTFTGRWQPTEDPLLIDDNGFQDIQNLRKEGKHLKGVSGHTKVNSSVWDATNVRPKNAFHFKKDQPAETHFIINAMTTGDASGKLYQNTTAIPSAGNFSGTVLHTDASGAGLGRFSTAPQGNMLYTNGAESTIWGGDELQPVSFITSTAAVTGKPTNPKDYSNQVRNTLDTADEVAVIGGGNDAEAVFLLHMDGTDAATTFTDSSATPHTVTANGNAQTDTAQKKFGSASGLFDGTGDYLSAPDSADWNYGSAIFTIDFWVRLNSIASDQTLFAQYVGVGDYYRMVWDQSASELTFKERIGSVNQIELAYSWSPVVDTWYHVALIRGWGGNVNDWSITIDGTSIGSETDGSPISDIAGLFMVGGDSTGYLNGWIDEFRVSKGKARWTTGFTPSANPYVVESNTWLVGSYRPLQGVKYYIGDANTVASTMTASEWNGSTWQSLTITDNTDTGASLAQDGTVTWTATDEAKVKLIEGLLLYWYQFAIDDGDATIKTVNVDAPFQSIKNIWSGETSSPIGFHVLDGGIWEDYSDHVNTVSTKEYSSDPYAAELDDLSNTEYAYVGFAEPVTALNVIMTAAANVNASTITVYYWDGAAWVSVGTVTDETEVGGNSLSASGYISWDPPEREEEFPQNLFGLTNERATFISTGERSKAGEKTKRPAGLKNVSAYYYKLMWSATLSTDVLVDTVQGVTTPKDIIGYDFPGNFQNRAWLFGDNSGEKNKAIHSMFNAPDVWNGIDSGQLYFGNDEELTAYATIYNMYKTSGVEQMLVTKANETYRVTGDSPETWDVAQMSGNVGCIAPLSMAVCEIADISQDAKRHVAIWQSSFGVVMSDGASIIPISEDIRAYWDVNDSRYIPTARQDDSVGWYNPNLGVYKLLISSGSGQAVHNVELEYSLKHQEWTKLYRENGSGANPLQVGAQVKDTDGNIYTYGATNEGTAYYLENGQTWDSTAIEEYVQTKDLLLDNEIPLMRHTIVNYIRVGLKEKATGATEDIDIIHYCDQGTATVDGTDDNAVPTDIDMADDAPFYTEDCYLGECLSHSFKFTVDVSTIDDGMELLGMGLYYETLKTIIVPE